jgi:hypothetical protein
MDTLRTLEILITSRTPLIATDFIVEELKATKPLSVTRAEDIEELREWARGRAVPAA